MRNYKCHVLSTKSEFPIPEAQKKTEMGLVPQQELLGSATRAPETYSFSFGSQDSFFS